MTISAIVRMGRPKLPPEERTSPRTIWMTDAEWAKVQAAPKGWVRGLVQRSAVGPVRVRVVVTTDVTQVKSVFYVRSGDDTEEAGPAGSLSSAPSHSA